MSYLLKCNSNKLELFMNRRGSNASFGNECVLKLNGTVVKTDFTYDAKWLFKVEDENQKTFFLMTSDFYKRYLLKYPVTKRALDSLFPGMRMDFQF